MSEREIINAFVDGMELVQLYRKPEDGRVFASRRPAEYAGFLKKSDVGPEMLRELRGSVVIRGIREDGSHWRVSWLSEDARRDYCQHPESPLVKAGIDVLEGDVDPVRRHYSDQDVKIAKPRRCYLDIETDSRVSFADKEKMRILSWAIVGQDDDRMLTGVLDEDTDRDERRLLEELWKALDPYDQVSAWYGDGFDFPVIFARSKYHHVKVDARRWLWIDQLEVFKKLHHGGDGDEKRSMKLEDIGQSITGRGKLQAPAWVTDRFGDKSLGALSWDLWEAGGEFRKLLVDYNAQDTALLKVIENKTGYLDLLGNLCDVCRLFAVTRSLDNIQQMDGYMLALGRKRDYRFPTKRFQEHVVKFKGAYVMQPLTLDAAWRERHAMSDGIARNVHVCDFSSMYPSIILTWNMSPDTKVDGPVNGPIPVGTCRSPLTGVIFETAKEGILPIAIKDLMKLRKYWNDLKSTLAPGTPEWRHADQTSSAYKIAVLAFYGAVGSPFSRFFDKNIAESITQCGVLLLKETLHAAEQRGFLSVYGDTDSAFIMGASRSAFSNFVQWCNETLYPTMLKNAGCQENHIKLAYEKEFDRVVFTSAKRYCNPPEAPIWMGDMSFKPLGEVKVGDDVIGWEDGKWVSKNKKRALVRSYVVAVHRHKAPILKLTMASGRVIRCTADHRWLHMNRSVRANGCQFVTPKVGRTLAHVIDVPRQLTADEALCASWLGGIFDGEGSLCSGGRGQICIAQSPTHNPEVCARIENTLSRLGFSYSKALEKKRNGCNRYAIRGRRQARLNFLTWTRPAKGDAIARAIIGHRFAEGDRIVRIEEDGEGEVIGLTTTTGNYVAWGYASKNCASYRHYKWTTTCTCTTAKGSPGSLDVKTMTCRDCGEVHVMLPPIRSAPEIRGLEYRRGDVLKMAADLQAHAIDLLVGGLGVDHEVVPTNDIERYHTVLSKIRQVVLESPLVLGEVKLSKGLSKPLKEYVVKVKKDGGDASQPPHVVVAKMLKGRGQDVREGTRIDYFVADGSTSPMKVLPAEDWVGECDRFYLWESLVYPPTERLLEAAFPGRGWSEWSKVRPPKVRQKGGKKGGVVSGDLFTSEDTKPTPRGILAPAIGVPTVPGKRSRKPKLPDPFCLNIRELDVPGAGVEDADAFVRVIRTVVDRHPGKRQLTLNLVLLNGASVLMSTSACVDVSDTFKRELQDAIANTPRYKVFGG